MHAKYVWLFMTAVLFLLMPSDGFADDRSSTPLKAGIIGSDAHALPAAEFKVGAAVIDITPERLPVIVSGSLTLRRFGKVISPLNVRAIVIADGKMRIGIAVVDTCLVPQPLADEVKALVAKQTKIPKNRILISANHCHTTPSLGDNLVSPDHNYVEFIRGKIVKAFIDAEANLEPASVGWATIDAAKYTAVRRWIRRTDRIENDVFGNPTVRAHMHAAGNWNNVTGASGPEDPELSIISFQAFNGRPIAVLANFSMHYFEDADGLGSDYYGLFCEGLKERLSKNRDKNSPPFVGIMSHGCSGDVWRADYSKHPTFRYMPTITEYSNKMIDLAMKAYRSIDHKKDVDLGMIEKRVRLKYRVPDVQRLKWALEIVEKMGIREPENRDEAYAREQVALHEQKSVEVILQAIRIGDIAIATTSTETYALTGLKLKLQSPFKKTMVIELANGSHGYIPSPAQHYFGGYNTWPMRGAGLEVQAEPIITEVVLGLLEGLSDKPRRPHQQSLGPAAQALVKAKPVAYWRLDQFEGPQAVDVSGQNRHAVFEPGIAFFLEGPKSNIYNTGNEQNRAAHFAGGRLRSQIANLGDHYSVSLWFWNGMPTNNGREMSSWMFSRGHNHGLGPVSEHLGVGGTKHPGKLVFLRSQNDGKNQLIAGRTEIKRWTWNHVVLVRAGNTVRVYLNGNLQPEINTSIPEKSPILSDEIFVGGRSDNQSNWEGRLDEVALFNRSLTVEEIEKLFSNVK